MLQDSDCSVCQTVVYAQKRDFIFYKLGKLASELVDLQGAKVGITRGYPFSKHILESVEYMILYALSDQRT